MINFVLKRRQQGDVQKLPTALPAVLRRVYAARGVNNPELLQKNLQYLLPPSDLKGIDNAVSIIAQGIQENKKIIIVGDFDCDGATSTALMLRLLIAMGAQQVDYLVPNRFSFGYGLSEKIVEQAVSCGAQLLITVDSGINCHRGVQAAKEAGMQVVITDHHLPGQNLPDADAIVNPNQPGCTFASKALPGVGVAFYLMLALRSYLREQKWFTRINLLEPNVAGYLDLVALGTVADVVPLDYNNRILVHQGLLRIRAGQACPGIQALIEISGREFKQMTTGDLGFSLGPRLNAVGRLDDMSLGINCLLSDTLAQARQIAQEMDHLNQARKAIEQSMQTEAIENLQKYLIDSQDLPHGLVLYEPGWHQGVVGLVASRLKERYYRPVIAFAPADESDVLKGSGRSIPGIHLRDVLQEISTRAPDLMHQFGGHAMAVGLSLATEHLPAFQTLFLQVLAQRMTHEQLTKEILTDGQLAMDEFSIDLARYLKQIEPWGQHFPEPLFEGIFKIYQQRLVGKKHLKLQLQLPQHHQYIDAIAFHVDLNQWPDPDIQWLHCAYRLDINQWQGKQTLQLLIEFLKPCQAPASLSASLVE